MHIALIAVHAAASVAAFAFGCLALRPPTPRVPPAFRLYLGALWLMVLALLAVVALDWGGLDLPSRALYAALSALALYTGWRGWRALRQLRGRAGGWRGRYVDDVGFTLITLFDGFVIILALDAGAPLWAIVLVGVLGVLVGRLVVERTKRGMVERHPAGGERASA